MKLRSSGSILAAFFSACLLLMVVTVRSYQGEAYVYILFSLALNALLYLGLRKDRVFFDFFIGGLLWLGYWLKFSVRTAFYEGRFHESVGYFDYSGDAYDKSLLVVTCGIAGLLVARVLRARFVFSYPKFSASEGFDGLFRFYEKYRTGIWGAFLIIVVAVAVSNAYLGIYQRGMAPRTVLPYKLSGVYTWILLFGGASVSALMLNFEVRGRRAIPILLLLIVLVETFASNLSMLSRGMVLNSGALLFGLWAALRMHRVSLVAGRIGPAIAMLVVLFVVSVGIVNYLRQQQFYGDLTEGAVADVGRLAADSKILLLDRWVGMEGAMATSSYPNLGWDLLRRVWQEGYGSRGSSLYDLEISRGVSKERNDWLIRNEVHFITIPGIIAFFFFPGSYVFLFFAMIVAGIIASVIEIATYKMSGSNVILCSLIAFVVAYRYAHFGYVPARSYLLFGTVVLNVAAIYLSNRILSWKYALRS